MYFLLATSRWLTNGAWGAAAIPLVATVACFAAARGRGRGPSDGDIAPLDPGRPRRRWGLRIALGLLGLAAAVLLAQNLIGKWLRRWTVVQGDGFVVSLPASARVMDDTDKTPLGDIRTRKWKAEMGGGRAVIFAVTDFPPGAMSDDPRQDLEQVIQQVVQRPGTELVSRRDVTADGVPGVEGEFVASKKLFKIRSYITGRRQYRLVREAPRIPDPDDERFFGSFRIAE